LKKPHDSWSKYYEFVYERTFGSFYENLTVLTLVTISRILPKGIIIDFGAGTGRLAIPLKHSGYDVIAVEKSSGMAKELKAKSAVNGLDIPVFNCSIAEYSNRQADLALAVFTVLSYSTTERELSKGIAAICSHLKPKGYFFFDLPNKVFFNAGQITNIQSNDFNRFVELTNNGVDNIYTYKEVCSGIFNEEPFDYEDEFCIRYWELHTLDKLLKENGLTDTKRAFPEFGITGSTYKLYQKV
jgi:SAM-dependent methyltransferase